MYRNYLLIMLESFDVTSKEKVLLGSLTSFAKLEGVSMFIAIKVPHVLSGQKLGVTEQAGSVSVVVSPRK